MKLWSKIDLTPFSERVDDLEIEGAYRSTDGTLIEGEVFDGEELKVIVQASPKGYRSFCTKCLGGLCVHSAELLKCFLRHNQSFAPIEQLTLEDELRQEKFILFQNTENKTKPKSLRKKFQKIIEGLHFAENILEDFLMSISSNSSQYEKFKERVSRLDEYFLSGLKLDFLDLCHSMTFLNSNDGWLLKLDNLHTLIQQSLIELDNQLKGDCLEQPFSELTTRRGHIWKMSELEKFSVAEDCQLLQLNFFVKENLLAQRLEENSVCVDIDKGEILISQNFRPFKALRHIPETDSECSLLACKELVKYPGSGAARVRWKECEKLAVDQEMLNKARAHAGPITKEEITSIKVELRDSLSLRGVYRFFHVDEVLADTNKMLIRSGDFLITLSDTVESRVLRSVNSSELKGAAGLFKIEMKDNYLELSPLCLINDSRILRLGF